MEKENKLSPAFWLLCAAAGLIYAFLCLSDNIWADEAYTFAMLRHSFIDILHITAADSHPPLYYLLAKVFTMPFGYSEYAVRAFSGVCSLLVVIIGGWQITRYFGKKLGYVFMALYTLFPFALLRATEARMYPLAALAITLNALFAYRIWLGGKALDWVGFAAAGLCAAYSHYYALVSAAVIYGLLLLCVLIRKRSLVKPWLITATATIVLYLPWVPSLLKQLANIVDREYGIESITLNTLTEYATELLYANGNSALPLFFGLIGLWLLVRACIRREGLPLLAALVCALTAGVGIAVSLLLHPVFAIRFLSPCAPLLIFFLAWGLCGIRTGALFGAAAGYLLLTFVGNLVFVGMEIFPDEYQFRAQTVEQTGAQAYVCLSENAYQVHQEAAYYNPDVPIYTTETLGDASPYTNVYLLEEFSSENYDTVLVFSDEGVRSSGFPQGYQTTLLGTYHSGSNTYDLWLLTRASK